MGMVFVRYSSFLFCATGMLLTSGFNNLHAERPKAVSHRGLMTVFAENSFQANTACMEADRVLERFQASLELPAEPPPIPIVISLGDDAKGEGDVRVFPTAAGMKLQTNWGSLPISRREFDRGIVRALCVREALAHPPTSFSQKNSNLRIPVWVTEGIAGWAAELPVLQESNARVCFLSLLHPNLSLDEALNMVEGHERLNPTQRAMAYVLCQGLVGANANRKHRFLRSLLWNQKETSRDWLEKLIGKDALEGWWRTLWKTQSARLPLIKMGFEPSLRLTRLWETDSFVSAFNPASLHPFFRTWLIRRFPENSSHKTSLGELREIRKDATYRRATALDWLRDCQRTLTPISEEELLSWMRTEGRHLQDSDDLSALGPIRQWFRTLPSL